MIHKAQTIRLSEQELVDCVYGTGGCNGGWMPTAWNYMISWNGTFPLSSYPYSGIT